MKVSTKLVIVCADCGNAAPRTGTMQRYCEPCSIARTRRRQLKWMRENPPDAATAAKYRSAARDRLKERGATLGESQRRGVSDLFRHGEPSAWCVRLSVPFSYAASKNHAAAMSPHGHVYLRRESSAYKQQVADAVALALSEIAVVTNRFYVDLIVQKPNHRGDAINVLDLVADAIKLGVGVDDRWLCVSGLDWQIIKRDPCILIGLGQDATAEARVCSHCGREMPLHLFTRNASNPGGYSRSCRECRRLAKRER